MKPLLLIGCGGHARSLIDLIETIGLWNIHGLVGQPEDIGKEILGYSVVGTDAQLGDLRQQCDSAVLAVGQLPHPTTRQRLASLLHKLSFQTPSIISLKAHVSRHALVGHGTVVHHGAIVNAGAVVGAHCILNSQALIEHDVHIGDHCHISTGALINGEVSIGNGSFIGSGAMLREGLSIPSNSVVSAGKRVMGWPLL